VRLKSRTECDFSWGAGSLIPVLSRGLRIVLGKGRPENRVGTPHHRWRRWFARLSVAALVTIAADVGSSFVFHTGTNSSIITLSARSGVTERVFVILPGYVMSGSITARAFYPFLGPTDGLIGVDYAQRDINSAEIFRRVRDAIRTLNPRQVILYGASMGGQIAADIALGLGREGSPFGRPVLVLDSAPRTPEDIRRPQWMLWTSCHSSGGAISSLAWAGISALQAKPPVQAGSAQVAAEAWHYGMWVGTPALTSQGCYLSHPKALPPSLDVQSVVFLTGEHPEQDPLIRISQAVANWRSTFPQMTVAVVSGRDAKWHLPLAEQPSETVKALLTATGS
jgi:pimeloyl-ACP methyl ester carboxylesterase